MAKKKKKSQQPSNALEPKSPPPAAPPPPEPPGETASLMGPVSYGSYHQEEQLRDQLQDGHANYGIGPTITHYNQNSVYASFGDISLRPNTGEDNWFDEEILGLALHEIMKTLQWSNIISCSFIIVLEIMSAIFRLFFKPPRLVLGCYLAFFASLLLRVEIAHIIKQHRDHIRLGDLSAEETRDLMGAIGGYTKVPNVETPALRDSFGFLFHPSGKASLLMLMASMCVGQNNNILELILGLVFGLNALFTFYLLCRYPKYRVQEDIPIPKLPPSPTSSHGNPRSTAASWSYYENDASSLWKVTSTIAEGASVLASSNRNSYRGSL